MGSSTIEEKKSAKWQMEKFSVIKGLAKRMSRDEEKIGGGSVAEMAKQTGKKGSAIARFKGGAKKK